MIELTASLQFCKRQSLAMSDWRYVAILQRGWTKKLTAALPFCDRVVNVVRKDHRPVWTRWQRRREHVKVAAETESLVATMTGIRNERASTGLAGDGMRICCRRSASDDLPF